MFVKQFRKNGVNLRLHIIQLYSLLIQLPLNIDFKLLDLFDQMFELGVDLLKLDDLALMKSRFSLSS